ncbi:MAG: toxin [Gammaproteobacteria bacterium]
MKPFRWSHEKNEQLKAERSISFEEVVLAIENGDLLDVLQHHNPRRYPDQFILVVAIEGYAYLAPVVEETDYYFMKTVIPSRKASRDYLQRGGSDEDA